MMSAMSSPYPALTAGHRRTKRRAAGQEIGLEVDDRHVGPPAREVQAKEAPLDKDELRAGLRPMMSPASSSLNRVFTGTSAPPGGEQSEGRDDPLGGVRRPDRDPVALVHASAGERPGGAADAVDQLTERQAQRRPSTTASASPKRSAALKHHLRDGLPRNAW